MTTLADINAFLASSTPDAWVAAAAADLDTVLVDHAHCEKKAASSALNLMFRYPDRDRLVHRMSRLAREELRHFEQVLKLMKPHGVKFRHMTPSRYAEGLRKHLRNHEPDRLTDLLIVGAFIEARSCERFQALAPVLEDREVADFYLGLCASESRHFRHYLELAEEVAGVDIDERVEFFRGIESKLNLTKDRELRFHSGPPRIT